MALVGSPAGLRELEQPLIGDAVAAEVELPKW
jgi:hypothetical protein